MRALVLFVAGVVALGTGCGLDTCSTLELGCPPPPPLAPIGGTRAHWQQGDAGASPVRAADAGR